MSRFDRDKKRRIVVGSEDPRKQKKKRFSLPCSPGKHGGEVLQNKLFLAKIYNPFHPSHVNSIRTIIPICRQSVTTFSYPSYLFHLYSIHPILLICTQSIRYFSFVLNQFHTFLTLLNQSHTFHLYSIQLGLFICTK